MEPADALHARGTLVLAAPGRMGRPDRPPIVRPKVLSNAESPHTPWVGVSDRSRRTVAPTGVATAPDRVARDACQFAGRVREPRPSAGDPVAGAGRADRAAPAGRFALRAPADAGRRRDHFHGRSAETLVRSRVVGRRGISKGPG